MNEWHTYEKSSDGPKREGNYLTGIMCGDRCGTPVKSYRVLEWGGYNLRWIISDCAPGTIVYKWIEIPGDDSDENSR